jgi:hypothetical protein
MLRTQASVISGWRESVRQTVRNYRREYGTKPTHIMLNAGDYDVLASSYKERNLGKLVSFMGLIICVDELYPKGHFKIYFEQ